MIDDIKINQFPYLGVSKNLMEFFVVIGYDERMIKESQSILENQKNIPLTIISNVISDLAYNMFEPSIIIKRVYPDKPPIIKSDKRPNPSSVIFSSCIDSLDGKKKIVNSCYALRFYEKYIDSNKEDYYVPKAFLIYSQYPYFATYHQICTQLLYYYYSENKDKIPIEILIYCFVNYISSPISGNIILKDLKLNITLPKLTGYPYADFSLVKIFNSIPLKDFIKIYILIYLEIELLFFSPDLEKLNMFMFMLYILNYPLTDSSYFWHIETISEKDLKSDFHTIMTGFKGVNTKYHSNLDLSRFRTVDFIIDLESENLIVNRKETKESKEIMKLLKYIDNILINNKKIKSLFLQKCLLSLKNKLKNLNLRSDINEAKEYISGSLFKMDQSINQNNRKIQEIFYDFVIDTLIILSKDVELDPTSKYPVNIKHYKDSNLSEEENIFLQRSRYSVKYNTYFDLFIRNFSVSDELKVSLLFVDEFVDFKKQELKKDIGHIPYFKIIDDLYFSKQNNFDFTFKSLEKEIINNLNTRKIFYQRKENTNSQLFILNKDLIKLFIFLKKNKGCCHTLKRQEEMKPESISKTSIITVTQGYFLKNYILKQSFFVQISLVYLFSMVFPLISFSKSLEFLEGVLRGLKKIKFFQRYYIFILLKSINKYYIVNKEIGQFPDFTFQKVILFYKTIQNYLISGSIIQNEEIFVFFQKVFSEKNQLEKDKYEPNETNENKEINETIEKKDKPKFIYNSPENDEYIEIGNNEIVTEKHKLLVFRRGNEIMGCSKIRLDLLYQQSYSLYDYYFSEYNFNIEKLEVDEIINLCINLLFELKKSDDINTKYHLYNLIPILKRLRNEINVFKRKNEEKEK